MMLASVLPTFAQFTQQQFNQLKKSIVRVDANQCASKDRSATGFYWDHNAWVVTSLHVVKGCATISIFSEAAGQSRAASIVRTLNREDLALLQIGSPIDGTLVLEAAARPPSDSEDLEVLGYPLEIPAMNNTTVRLRFGGRTLRDIVPQAVADELSLLGSPNPNISITNIEGHLLPGHSGAPILNNTGEVVAVADGGLESGVVGVSWGLPVASLLRLSTSPDPITGAVTQSSGHLFAAETNALDGAEINCGGGTFKKIRELAFADILHATDDPLGLQQIVSLAGSDVPTFKFDIYQQLSNGATFAVPAGSTVTSDGAMCSAISTTGNVVVRAFTVYAPSDPTGQQSSVQYETTLLGTPGWVADPVWTYVFPIQRFDGFVVRRRSYVHFGVSNSPGLLLDQTLFETLAARKSVFLGVSALNRQWTLPIIQTVQLCKLNPQVSPSCAEALSNFREWAQAVIAVHLATFPIG